MNVALSVIFVLEIATELTTTEAFPNWNWGARDKHKWWDHHHSKTYDSCAVGQCVKACDCPEHAIAAQSEKDSCIYKENGPWVCCLVNDGNFHHFEDTIVVKSSESPNNFKHTTVTELKVTTVPSTQNYGYHKYGGTRKAISKGVENMNDKEKPFVRSVGSILKNEREVYPFFKPKNKTLTTKIPNISISNSVVETYNKSATNTQYKQTTYLRNKFHTPTTSPNYYKRTSRPDKSHISTTSQSNKYHISTQSTNYKKTINLWEKSYTATTSSSYYKGTTELSDKSLTSTQNTNNKRTVDFWDKHGPSSDHKIIFPSEGTRHFTPSVPTKRSWIQSGSTKLAWGHTTKSTRKPVSTTTKYPYLKKSTVATKASTQSRNQSPGSSATTHSARSQTLKPKTTKQSFVRTTVKSTRRYSVTTPMPNVNIHLCGIRDERTVIHRQARDGHYPATDVVHYGNTGSKSRLPFQRIVGGQEAEPFSWPWVAALYKVTSSGGNRFLSAGSLINEDFILTAAHVFTPDDLRTASYVVMLGTHDVQDAVAQYAVSSVLLHPNYEHRYYYNDIALLKLERKVAFNDYIMPICLPSPHAPLHMDRDLLGKNVTVMGWGDDSFGGKSSQVLKEATFPIVSRVSCNASYVRVASNRFPKGITAEMLCAGDPKGGKDACQGDSGGPLTVIANGRFTQVGIVSFGYKCGDKEFPGVYTKVAPYLSWIAENTKYVADYDYYL